LTEEEKTVDNISISIPTTAKDDKGHAKSPEDFKRYYNAEVEAIQDIKGTQQEIAEEIKNRILKYGNALFSLQAATQAADQYLRAMYSKMDAEHRQAISMDDLRYKPLPVKPPRSTKSPKEKTLEQIEKQREKDLVNIAKAFSMFTTDASGIEVPDLTKAQAFIDSQIK
jgi:hypothetical protein